MAPAVASKSAADQVSKASSSQRTENAASEKMLAEMLKNLSLTKTKEEAEPLVGDFAVFINGGIEEKDAPHKAFEKLEADLKNKKDTFARERAALTIKAIAAHSTVSPAVEPFLVAILPSILGAIGDKQIAVKKAADSAVLAIATGLNSNAVKAALPHVLHALGNTAKWQEKMTCLEFIEILCQSSPVQTGYQVPALLPVVSDAMWDTKKEVKVAAHGTAEKVCALISNKDIERFIPELIKCIAAPENVPETIHLLGATTFVQDVHSPTLALMVPLLERGLAERETAIKRKAAVIVDNMCKLVEDPQIVAPFLPKLMPALTKNYENLPDPEAREKTQQALKTLTRVGAVVDGKIPEISNAGAVSTVVVHVKDILSSFEKAKDAKYAAILTYIAAIGAQMIDEQDAELTSWVTQLTPYIAVLAGEENAKGLADSLRKKASPNVVEDEEELPDEEEGEDLCNCTFNLAYGAKILLNQTHLRLKRGVRYGILGPNGSGKTTLMRAINNEQVEGFPKQNEVKTVYVEHDLDSSDTELTVVDWTMMKLRSANIDQPQKEVEVKLLEFGFSDEMMNSPITSLSGGWKMKLALARAVFEKPDILLLDEPTNHLDVKNVAWLESYLVNSPCTSLIISHDVRFLDKVIQNVIHYETNFKLKRYRGNVSEFVKKQPKAKSYYELSASEMMFTFPEPGFLEGVKTKAKAIVRVRDMSFQYPTANRPQLMDINFQLSLGSRISVIGPNGAGKSTLVNVLTGELLPTTGEVYQHENIRIAYVKQHAFAHIDSHLDKTPSEYIQWRFASGEDRETMDRANKIVTDEDIQMMDKVFDVEHTKRRVIGIHSRRKFKNTYEYECSFTIGENIGLKTEKWTPLMTVDNRWLPRGDLLASHQKMVADVDQKEALASGQFRPLVRKEIEKHCSNFGLDAELTSHSRMKGLSGGQRVKVVLSAGSWLRPHVLVLDEPTNYLDRDSLGALSKGLKAFEGGVVIISHSSEFTQDLTEEVWSVLDGRMTPSGHNWVQGQGAGPRLEEKKKGDEEEERDAMGNIIASTKKKAKMSSNEARKKRKDRMARRKRGEEVFSDEE
jgi:elongation factor 3